MTLKIDKRELLSRLEKLLPEKKGRGMEDLMRQISMSSALPALTGINHEREYLLIRQLALHLVGRVHEPDVANLD